MNELFSRKTFADIDRHLGGLKIYYSNIGVPLQKYKQPMFISFTQLIIDALILFRSSI